MDVTVNNETATGFNCSTAVIDIQNALHNKLVLKINSLLYLGVLVGNVRRPGTPWHALFTELEEDERQKNQPLLRAEFGSIERVLV